MTVPPPYRIRHARREEIPLLGAIKRVSAMRFSTDDIPEPHRSTHIIPEHILHQALADGLLWVAADAEDRPVGYALLRPEGEHLTLHQVDVLPEHGGKGLGRALVETGISRSRELGRDALYLTTFAHLPWNAPFYAKLGFTVTPDKELPGSILNILEEERAVAANRVAMRLELSRDRQF